MLNAFLVGLIVWRTLPHLLLVAASLFMAADLWWLGGLAILSALLWLYHRHINGSRRKQFINEPDSLYRA